MAAKKRSVAAANQIQYRPAETPEARENQMIAMSMNLAEQQLRDGTASSQVITHFLKLGTAKAKIELENLEMQKKLTEAKTKQIESAEKTAELYANAIKAMGIYSGRNIDEETEEL